MPQRRVVEGVQERRVVAVGRGIPSADLRRLHQPAQKIFRGLLIRGVAEDGVAPRRQDVDAMAARPLWIERLGVGFGVSGKTRFRDREVSSGFFVQDIWPAK